MWGMKEWFLRFGVHAMWRKRKGAYYAVSVLSIAGNLVVLAGPTVQTSILSHSRALPTIGLLQTAASTFGSLQTALQAASTIGALHTRAWNALPQVAELVLQRSMLYILLNLIVARIIFKSGVLAGRTSLQQTSMKQDELRSVQIVCGSHGLAHTVCSTMSNFADVSTGPSMLLQHAHHLHGRASAAITDASKQLIQIQGQPNDSLSQGTPAVTAAAAAPSPAPSPPSLFTIEPLDELVQSMLQPHQAPILEAQIMSRHPLGKVATQVDLLQTVRARRLKVSRLIADRPNMHHQIKSGRSMQGVKDKQIGIRRKEHNMVQFMKEYNMVQSMMQGKVGNGGGGMEGELREDELGGAGDDNELSKQEFNERVDTFISKFKRNLTMQRKDSLNRLLGLTDPP